MDIDAGQAGFFLPGLPPTTRTNNVKISGGTVKINAPISAIHINHQEDGQAGERIQITGGEVQLSANSRECLSERPAGAGCFRWLYG